MYIGVIASGGHNISREGILINRLIFDTLGLNKATYGRNSTVETTAGPGP